jgi:aminopeptidase N
MRSRRSSLRRATAALAGAAVLGASAGCTATAVRNSAPPSSSTTSTTTTTEPPVSSSAPHGQGVGDDYYPDDGNRGYDVKGYHVSLDYYRRNQSISATATITSTATARLTSLNFDLVGMRVRTVTVDGVPARFHRAWAHELVVTPEHALPDGRRFVTKVTYDGKPGVDPVGAITSGWYDATTPGAGFIAGEPHSCTLWYPCNDHPTDKARFSLAATVPRPFAVISNGYSQHTTPGMRGATPVRTYRWTLTEPTATYLTTIYIDKLTFERSTLPDGTPVVSAYGPDPGSAPEREAKLPEILRMLESHWGPYPAPAAGGIFVSGEVPFSLEVFTRPLYTEGADVATIVHENAHEWWGDNISVRRWKDICFNECLASYSQWLWDEHNGADLDARYDRGVKGRPSWLAWPLYDMGAGHEFEPPVYFKGQYFIHALRNKIGDRVFFAAMREIQRTRSGLNMSMMGLRDALEHETGVDLTSFWSDWVLHARVPSHANLYPGDL